MSSKIILAILLAATAACATPKLPDPRFVLADPPQELTQKAPPLKKIESPNN